MARTTFVVFHQCFVENAKIFLCWCTKTLKIFAKTNCLLLSFSFAVEQKTFTDLHTFLLISARMFLVRAKFENCIYSVCFMLSTFMFKNIFLCRVQTFLLRTVRGIKKRAKVLCSNFMSFSPMELIFIG